MNNFKKISDKILFSVNSLFSFFILMMIVALVVYSGYKVFYVFLNFENIKDINILHEAAILVVLVKAYRVLLHYYRKHSVSIKYIMEISIIAPAIDVVFASDDREVWATILFTIFSLGNLILYLYFYDKLSEINKSECKREKKEN